MAAGKRGWRTLLCVGCFAGLTVHMGNAGAHSAAGPPESTVRGSGLRPELVAREASTLLAQFPREGAEIGAPGGFDAPATFTAPQGAEWRIPPVRWGGNLTTEIREVRTEGEARRMQAIGIASIRASSYIWEPWFARVSGGLGWIAGRDSLDAGSDASASQFRGGDSTAATGSGEATIFPLSRFPFNASFEVGDSRASGEQTLSDYTTVRFGARQTYRPPEGNANYAASYDRSTLDSEAFGRDTVSALAASLNRSAGPQTLDAHGRQTRNTRSDTGESTALKQFDSRHSYRPGPAFSVESLASATASDFHLVSAGVPSDSHSQFTQASTFLNWRPGERSPLNVTGGGRVFRARVANNAGESDAVTLSGNLGASYALTGRTILTGSLTATDLHSDTAENRLMTQSAGVSHVGDPVALPGSTYTWNAAANFTNQNGLAEGDDRRNGGGLLGHNFTRHMTLDEGSQLSLGLGQSYGKVQDTATGGSQTLINSANLSWRVMQEAATSTYVSLGGSDSRTSGYNANHFQLVNFQASGQMQFSRSASAAANLTVQGINQRRENTPETGFTFNTSGNLSYFHMRALDVPDLRYSALLSVNESQYRTRQQGDVNAPRDHLSRSFEHRLDYSVGRIAMRLSFRDAVIDGRDNRLVFFRLTRVFGAY